LKRKKQTPAFLEFIRWSLETIEIPARQLDPDAVSQLQRFFD